MLNFPYLVTVWFLLTRIIEILPVSHSTDHLLVSRGKHEYMAEDEAISLRTLLNLNFLSLIADNLIQWPIAVMQYEHHTVQSLSRVQLFATPWTAACQASLSITNSMSLLKLMSIKLVMPSNHLILCYPLLLLLLIFSSIRDFSNESVLRIRWPKYWSFSISLSNEYSELISFRMD